MNEIHELHDWMQELRIDIMCKQGSTEELIKKRKLHIKINRIRERMQFKQREYHQNKWGSMWG